MQNRNRGSAFVVVLLVVFLAVGIGATFCGEPDPPEIDPGRYSKREADLLCDAFLLKARQALWFYRTERAGNWDRILADLERNSIDPKLHRREYIDKVNGLLRKAGELLIDVERNASSLKRNEVEPARRVLQQINDAVYALAYAKEFAGEMDSRWSETVAHAFDLDRSVRTLLPRDSARIKNPRYVLEEIAQRSSNRFPLPDRPTTFFGKVLPSSGRAVKIVVRDNQDGDDDPLRDQDGKVYVYVTALLPDSTLAQTQTLVEFDPAAPDHAVRVLESRKLR